MKSIKEMTQKEYDKYLLLEVIPDLIDGHGSVSTVILNKNKLQFANVCKFCGDLIMLQAELELCDEIAKLQHTTQISYLESLTELEIIENGEFLECECDEDDLNQIPDEDEEDLYLDPEDDYGDANIEY